MARRRRNSGNGGTTIMLIVIGILIYILFPRLQASKVPNTPNGNNLQQIPNIDGGNGLGGGNESNSNNGNGNGNGNGSGSGSSNNFNQDEAHDAVIFVVGNTQNSPAPELTDNKNIKNVLENVFYSTPYGEKPNIVIFSAAGNPYTLEINDKYYLGQAANDLASASNFNDLLIGIENATNSSPACSGADYFAAIMEALEYSKNFDNPLIIVYGSGLSDTGVFNFAFDNLITDNGNEAEIVNAILSGDKRFSNESFPNVTLYWYGVGQSVGEQPDLKEWKKSVQNTYAAIFEYFDITYKFYLITLPSDAVSVDAEYSVIITILPIIEENIKISLNERYLSFYADSAKLKNEDEVRKLLKGVAETLNENESAKIKLTGYQTVCAKTKTLGVKRANTIKGILVDLGVDENRITTDGVAGPPDNRKEVPRCGSTGVAVEHRTVILETYN